LKTTKYKLYALQALPTILVIWLYAVAMMGFNYIILKQLNINFSSAYLSIILSSIGVALGIVFYFLTNLKSNTKFIISIISTRVLVMVVLIAYIFGGILALQYLGVIGFFFLMSTIALISVYAILKNQKMVFFSSALGLMFFYFILILLSKAKPDTFIPFYTDEQVELLLLFFILFIFYIELGSISIYFKNVIKKMTPNQEIDELMIKRFNKVFNRYVFFISIFLITSYLITLMLLLNANFIEINEIMGINLSSAYGVILLVSFTFLGAILFWILIPREKTTNNSFNEPKITNINEE